VYFNVNLDFLTKMKIVHLLMSELRKLDIPLVDIKLVEHNAQIYCGMMKTLGVSH